MVETHFQTEQGALDHFRPFDSSRPSERVTFPLGSLEWDQNCFEFTYNGSRGAMGWTGTMMDAMFPDTLANKEPET